MTNKEVIQQDVLDINVGDTISRQAAIDFIDAGHLVNPNEPRWSDNEVVNFLKSRPSAQPERCSDCIVHGGDWECDYMHCRKGRLPSAQSERTEERTETHACDLISRSAAIDYLIGRYSDQLGLMDAQDIIDQLNIVPSAQPELQWISVSERLPEQYGNYLVSFKTDEPDIGTFNPDTGEWSSCDANGFYWVASKGLEVIAWMPLPEPYQAERREE